MTEDPSYINQSIDLLCKSIDWFLYDKDFRHERVENVVDKCDALCKSVEVPQKKTTDYPGTPPELQRFKELTLSTMRL